MGARPFDAAQGLYGTYPLSRLLLLEKSLKNLEVSGDSVQLAVMTVTRETIKETQSSNEEGREFVEILSTLAGVNLSVLFWELKAGEVHVHLRSRGALNVAAFAEQYGGGGHANAAGCTLKGDPQEIRERVLKALKRSFAGNASGEEKD
jgi:phosphoesterase RecJ-like protein